MAITSYKAVVGYYNSAGTPNITTAVTGQLSDGWIPIGAPILTDAYGQCTQMMVKTDSTPVVTVSAYTVVTAANPQPPDATWNAQGEPLWIDTTTYLQAYTKGGVVEENVRELWKRTLTDAGLTLAAGSFEEGGTLTSSSQALLCYAYDQAYTWAGSFPKTVPINSTPDLTGGILAGAWVSVGDTSLRQQLAAPGGAALIGPGVMSRGLDKFSILQGRSGEAFAGDYTRGIAVQLNEPITGSGSPVSTAQINLIEINADRLNVVDDTSPGTKVDGFMVFHKFGGAGSKGGRHAIEAILDQTAITESSNTDRNYVGIAGTATSSIGDGGTSAADAKGTYYGGNFVGILNPGATFTQVVTGAEFNAGIKTGASANIRTGLQIGSLGNDRGGVIDAAIMFNCGPSQPAWRSGLHFGKQTGGSPLNATSRAIRIDVDNVDSVLSISSTTVVNKLIDHPTVSLTPVTLAMKSAAATVEIGSDTTAGSTQLRFRTSGTGVASDTAVICSGGNGTPNSGNFEVKAGTVTYSCSQRPNVDNVYDYGAANFRGRTAYFGTGSINTSDDRHKPIKEKTPDSLLDAWEMVDWGTRFKFDDAIAIKGEGGARWHFGLIAQRVEAVFAEHGIDGFSLGLLCYDEWDSKAEIIDESGKVLTPAIEAGNRYGIRYEEALSLEAALQRRNYERMKDQYENLVARVEALESK